MRGGKAPNAAQRRWWSWLIDQGCYIGLGDPCIHHAVGSSARHRKVEIGNWFVVPLSYEAHQGVGGIHGDLSAFVGHGLGATRKEIEKSIFRRLVAAYRRSHGEYPMPADVIAAVEDYHR